MRMQRVCMSVSVCPSTSKYRVQHKLELEYRAATQSNQETISIGNSFGINRS